jgi:hypothetical protein
MPSTIVTTTYRYKRPPRKKKPIVLTGSAIVTPPPKRKAKAHGAAIVRRVKPGNDNRLDPTEEKKSAIVTANPKGRRTRVDDGQEASPELKAFLARMMRPPGQ